MSIQSEISRIKTNITNALNAVASKGVTVPAGANSDNLAELISKIVAAPAYTNWLPISTDESGNVFNGCGYETGKRFNSSNSTTSASDYAITGFITAKKGDVIRLNSALWVGGNQSYMQIKLYDDTKTAVFNGYISLANAISNKYAQYSTGTDGTHILTLNSSNATYAGYFEKTAYIRLTVMANACADGIITVNEEIT